MGCAGSKADGEGEAAQNDVVLNMHEPEAVERTASAIKGGHQDPTVRASRRSISYQSKELPEDEVRRSDVIAERLSAQFDADRIGTFTLHGVMPGPKGTTSKAKINQDRGVVCWPFCGSYNMALLAVFDGHGSRGEKASEFCMKRLPEVLEEEYDALLDDPAACLKRAFVAIDEELRLESDHKAHMFGSGTTATVAFMRGTAMWVAWVGDSRAIKASRVTAAGPAAAAAAPSASSTARASRASRLSKEGSKDEAAKPAEPSPPAVLAADLSRDHKPDDPSERARIEAAGGTIRKGGSSGEGAGSLRVWNKGAVGLAMSRSIGDGTVKEVGVVAEPEVARFELAPLAAEGGDLFVLLASDGVWEFISSQEAADVVIQHPKDATHGCEQLVLLAADRWKAAEEHHRDDITAILAFLPFLEEDEADAGGQLLSPIKEASGKADALFSPPSAKSVGSDGSAKSSRFINSGERGITRMPSKPDGLASPPAAAPAPAAAAPAAAAPAAAAPAVPPTIALPAIPEPPPVLASLSTAPADDDDEDDEEEVEEDDFSRRRLSVFDPYEGDLVEDETARTSSWAKALGSTEL